MDSGRRGTNDGGLTFRVVDFGLKLARVVNHHLQPGGVDFGHRLNLLRYRLKLRRVTRAGRRPAERGLDPAERDVLEPWGPAGVEGSGGPKPWGGRWVHRQIE